MLSPTATASAISAATGLLDAGVGLLGGSGSGNQWLGVRSVPVHPVGIVSSRQRETRTVPVVPSSASKMRMLVPSFGAVLIGCHFGGMAPNPLTEFHRHCNADDVM
jgi:hypothetical protein